MQDVYSMLYAPIAIALWVSAAFSGPALGPLISGFAVMAARALQQVAEDRRRFVLLAALADVGDGAHTLDETVEMLLDLLVPAFAVVFLQLEPEHFVRVVLAGEKAQSLIAG